LKRRFITIGIYLEGESGFYLEDLIVTDPKELRGAGNYFLTINGPKVLKKVAQVDVASTLDGK